MIHIYILCFKPLKIWCQLSIEKLNSVIKIRLASCGIPWSNGKKGKETGSNMFMNVFSVHLFLVRILYKVQLKANLWWKSLNWSLQRRKRGRRIFQSDSWFLQSANDSLGDSWKHPGDKWIRIAVSTVFSGKALLLQNSLSQPEWEG